VNSGHRATIVNRSPLTQGDAPRTRPFLAAGT
jgi:hypothetical protein